MIYAFYILLLIGFLVLSGLILRYLFKFGHLAPRFKWVVILFGTLAIIAIIFSVYLLTQFDQGNSSSTSRPNLNTNSNSSSSSANDLNF